MLNIISTHLWYFYLFLLKFQIIVSLYPSPDSEVTKSYSSRFFRYYNALEEGRKAHQKPLQSANSDGGVCHQLFGTCPNDMSDTVNMDVLRIMQYLTRKFKIQFADTA